MNGWSSKVVTLTSAPLQVVGASATNTPISTDGWPLTAGGATKGIVIKIKCSAVTAGAGITAKLRTAIGSDYEDSKTVAVTGNGSFYIKILNDAAFMPLLNKGVVVLTTGVGSTATIDAVEVLQEL